MSGKEDERVLSEVERAIADAPGVAFDTGAGERLVATARAATAARVGSAGSRRRARLKLVAAGLACAAVGYIAGAWRGPSAVSNESTLWDSRPGEVRFAVRASLFDNGAPTTTERTLIATDWTVR